MHRFCRRLPPLFWNHKFGTPHRLQRSINTKCLTRFYSSLYSAKTLNSSQVTFLRCYPDSLIFAPKFVHTESQDGKHDNPQQEHTEDERPVPHFKNVLQHLRQQYSIFASGSTENADFCSILDQLASMDKFSTRLNSALKQKLDSQPDYLLEQSLEMEKQNILQHRDSLAVYSNSALLYPNLTPQKQLSINFITEYISAMILSILDYRTKLSKESSELLSQMFGSCCSPGTKIDTQSYLNSSTPSDLSIVLSRQSNFFILELNEKMVQGEMLFVLKKVVEFILAYKNPESVPFGCLSTLPRTDATFGYQFLNETGLRKLQESQFLVNLDQVNLENIDRDELAKHILVGNGENIGNRWFDKAIQLVLVLNEKADQIAASGICFEKSLVSPESVVDLMQHGIEFITKFKVSTCFVLDCH